jgi:hypothetical protein
LQGSEPAAKTANAGSHGNYHRNQSMELINNCGLGIAVKFMKIIKCKNLGLKSMVLFSEKLREEVRWKKISQKQT